jgi:CRP-like cAMP-binding protein
MPEIPSRRTSANHILSRLSPADFALLGPHLEAVDLPLRMQLEARNKRVEHVYFIESGFASIVANGSGKPSIEVGVIGKEGMTGLPVVLGNDGRVPNETFMQATGTGMRMQAADLRAAIGSSVSLQHAMLRFVNAFLAQISRTAATNGRSKIDERLARWLLMAADRVDGELKLTQEFLAIMLGVRRSGVTISLKALERAGLISHRRGVITILDRDALVQSSKGTYAPPDSD